MPGMICTIDGDTCFCSQRTHVLETLVHHVISWMMIQVFLMSLTSMSWFKEAQRICQWWKKWSFASSFQQVDSFEGVHTLSPSKFCHKAGTNLFSLACKLSQGKKISSDHWNNNVVESLDGDIILDCQIKTFDSWVEGVKFLCELGCKRTQSATASHKKNINDLIHLNLSFIPLLKLWVYKSHVPSSCVKIALWESPNSKMLLLSQKCWEKGFSSI